MTFGRHGSDAFPMEMTLAERLRIFGTALKVAPGVWKHPVYAQTLLDGAGEIERLRALLDAVEGDKGNTRLSGRDGPSDERRTTMVERVKFALQPYLHDQITLKAAHDAARDAIEAMRVPTEEMIDAYVDVVARDGKGPRPLADVAPERWQTMIDAALDSDCGAPRPEGASNPSPKGKEEDDACLPSVGGNTRPDGAQ